MRAATDTKKLTSPAAQAAAGEVLQVVAATVFWAQVVTVARGEQYGVGKLAAAAEGPHKVQLRAQARTGVVRGLSPAKLATAQRIRAAVAAAPH